MIAPRPRLSQLFARIWASETLMTWLSFLVRSLNFLLVLPILLRMLPDAEFAAFMSFQPTFIGFCADACHAYRRWGHPEPLCIA
jgi:hypothetical protein